MFDENGEEPGTPYKELLQALKDANYEGFIAAEYEGWLMQPLDSKMIAQKHINLINKYGK
jgi:sugar phosphate isomerase/epimerase